MSGVPKSIAEILQVVGVPREEREKLREFRSFLSYRRAGWYGHNRGLEGALQEYQRAVGHEPGVSRRQWFERNWYSIEDSEQIHREHAQEFPNGNILFSSVSSFVDALVDPTNHILIPLVAQRYYKELQESIGDNSLLLELELLEKFLDLKAAPPPQ